jgi:hypothetical protein
MPAAPSAPGRNRRWYRHAPVRRSEDRSRIRERAVWSAARAVSLVVCAGVAGATLAGCGETKQSAGEPTGSFDVQVAQARFSRKEAISRPATLSIAVRNTGDEPLPNVAVTVDSLSYKSTFPDLADRERPTWVIHTGPGPVARPPVESEEVNPPGGAQTAFVHTWALGRLAPGATQVFRWKLMPVRSGTHTVHYSIAAGLYGAKARLADGSKAAGTLTVHVAGKPPRTHVDPQTGEVAAGEYKGAAGPVGAVP